MIKLSFKSIFLVESWPKGKYTLVKPKSGCPSGWVEGWRFQDNEDYRNDNWITSGHHFYGNHILIENINEPENWKLQSKT